MKAKARTIIKQLKTGVHLVAITDASIIKDEDNMPLVTESGETGVTIRFSDGQNNHYEQDYWLNGDRQHYFNKMCASARIDINNPKFKAESKGKRLWICIKEVHEIDGDKPVLDSLEQPVINYVLFDTIPCLDPQKKPIVKGDPEKNNGIATGEFLDYKQIQQLECEFPVAVLNQDTGKFETVKNAEMIEEKIKESIKAAKDPFDEEEFTPKVEPKVEQPNTQSEIDWDNF